MPNEHSSTIARSILAIEREWLGLPSPPLAERLRAASWTPESIDASCHKCGRSVGAFEADDTGCSDCRSIRPPWDRFVRLGEYDGVLGEVVREIKFARFRSLGHQVGRMLGKRLGERLETAGIDPALALLIPVPMSRRRFFERGIDHTLVISRGMQATLKCRIVRYLSRMHGPTQLAVTTSERQENVSTVFIPRRFTRGAAAAPVYVVVDDVRTTGSSMRSACRALRKALHAELASAAATVPSVWACVVATSDATR